MLVLDLADDLLEDVLDGGDADRAAVFVDHDGHALARPLQLDQQIDRRLILADEDRRARDHRPPACSARPALSMSNACTVPTMRSTRSR